MRKVLTLAFLLAFSAGWTGCTWVKTTPAAQAVRITSTDRVVHCKRLGTVSSYTKASVAGIKRKASKVQGELEALARQEAADMGADTIVPAGGIKEGRQSFVAYRCQSN